MKYLVITADDFGMAECVNEAIRQCMDSRIVLSTNVMTNMPFAHEAKDLKKRYPYASIGLHYNFTVGSPVSALEAVSSLVDEQGIFHSYRRFRELYKQGKIQHDHIALEMKNQYQRFVDITGVEPDYWNTHENIHVARKLFPLFRDVSLKFGIHRMRTHRRLYVPASSKHDRAYKWLLMEPVKSRLLVRWQKQSQKLSVNSPDGILLFMQQSDSENPRYFVESI